MKRTSKDIQWSKNVRNRDLECVICGKKDGILNAHHILPKDIAMFRYKLDNGILLCFNCHRGKKFSAHQNALWFHMKLMAKKPKLWEKAIQRLSNL